MKTTIKVSKTTVTLLKQIAERRKRNESLEQIILELLNKYDSSN